MDYLNWLEVNVFALRGLLKKTNSAVSLGLLVDQLLFYEYTCTFLF